MENISNFEVMHFKQFVLQQYEKKNCFHMHS